MNAVEKNLLAKSKEYAELREQLRGRARAYAQDRVGGSNANSRARNMLASAFDAGVSAMVERTRAMIEESYGEQLITPEEYETLIALRTGEARVILAGVGSGDSAGAIGARTGSVRGADGSGGGSTRVATVARENERDESAPEPEQDAEEEHVWEVGEYCVWTEHPEYGSARIKWIGSKVLFGTKRCKLYFERFDRVEEATLRELALIEVVR
jgi:hypothetical protein